MKLSVAMCTYNGARYLRGQLASIAAQTRLPDELVVCDDCSSDETRSILEEFKARAAFPVRLYFNERNLRVWKNFEQAIRLCEGDIIALCDQDDVWLPEKLERMEEAFVATPDAGLVFCDLEVVDDNLQPLGYRAWHALEFGERGQAMFRQGKAFNTLTTRNVVTGAAMAFRAEYRDLVLPVPEVSQWLLHDYWFALTISTVAKLVPIKTPLVKYRAHPNQHNGLGPPRSTGDPWVDAQNRMRDYPVQNQYLELILERLSKFRSNPQYDKACVKLENRIKHGQIRASWVNQRYLRRAWSVIRELLTRRYYDSVHPDSNGWRDALNNLTPYKLK